MAKMLCKGTLCIVSTGGVGLYRVPPTPHNSCVLPELQEAVSDSMAGASKAVLMQSQPSGPAPPLVPHNSAASNIS